MRSELVPYRGGPLPRHRQNPRRPVDPCPAWPGEEPRAVLERYPELGALQEGLTAPLVDVELAVCRELRRRFDHLWSW
jgi:hypothetical protein